MVLGSPNAAPILTIFDSGFAAYDADTLGTLICNPKKTRGNLFENKGQDVFLNDVLDKAEGSEEQKSVILGNWNVPHLNSLFLPRFQK